MLIEQFREPKPLGDILDLGCGYGPIGITLAHVYEDRHIVMADVNERALNLAAQNAQLNNVHNVSTVQSDRFSGLTGRSFAAVVTNPPIRAGKKVVHTMFEESKDMLVAAGELWVVIQKKQGAPSAKDKLLDIFGNVDVVARDKGYYILKAVNV